MAMTTPRTIPPGADTDLIRRVRAGEPEAVREVIGGNNQRLYRIAWSILGDRAEAEDVMQEAYLKAFAALDGFKGEASLSTWLTRIVINEALTRRRGEQRRARRQQGSVAFMEDYRQALAQGSSVASPADKLLFQRQVAHLLETAISRLPEPFRAVLVLREVEGLSVEEVADILSLAPATVRTRLHRAKNRLQQELDPQLSSALAETFQFAGARCAALTALVMARLGY
jgi:RNA polymerase sigma-70 factor (ECF subfamily)